MSEKKADKRADHNVAPPNNTRIHIACPYELRLLSQLLRGQTSRKILDEAIGTTNSPEYVRRLRDRGKAGVPIGMEWVSGLNRDGRRVRWGEYYLLPADCERVKLTLGVKND